MAESLPDDLTVLITESRGDEAARQRLFELVYGELREIAGRIRHVGRPGDTMQPTALANEAYLLFCRRFPMPPRDQPEHRATFFRTVAMAMRTILRDHWRKKQTARRGGDAVRVVHGEPAAPDPGEESGMEAVDFLDLDKAMNRLEQYNRRWYDVILYRYFAGQTIEETASHLGCSVTTVTSDWKLARAWLKRELGVQIGEPTA